MKDDNMLVHHERDEDGHYTGLTFALIRDNNTYFLGIAKCSFEHGDQFSRKKGYMIATRRAKHMQDMYFGNKQMRALEPRAPGYPMMMAWIEGKEERPWMIPDWMIDKL